MSRYPVVNLGRPVKRLGQEKGALEQACDVVNYYNMFPGDDDSSMAAKQSAIDAMKGFLSNIPEDSWQIAVDQIKKGCNSSEDLFDHIYIPRPENPMNPWVYPAGQMVPSVDTQNTPLPPPPLKPGTPGIVPKGAPVASVEEGCWYAEGSGYTWGARTSGSMATGLDQAGCEQQMRELAPQKPLPLPIPTTPTTASQIQPQTTTPTPTQGMAPPPPQPPPKPPMVATGGPGSCGPGQFWDGTRCRGSVASIPSLPGGLAPSGGAALPPGGLELPPGLTEGISAAGLGRRIPLVRGLGTRALESR